MHLTQVLSIAHWPPMERQNMSGGAPLTHKICLADRAHPGLNGPVHFFLMRDVALWVRKSLRTVQKGQYSILRKSPPTLYPFFELEPEQLICLGPPFFPTNCPQQRNSPPSNGLGLKWKRLLQR